MLVPLARAGSQPLGPPPDRGGTGSPVRRCLRLNQPGPLPDSSRVLNAVHSDAPTAAETDWSQILAARRSALRDQPPARSSPSTAPLRSPRSTAQRWPSNRSPTKSPLEHYYLFHAIRANLLRRLGHGDQAEAAYRSAIQRTDNAAEIAFMREGISAIRADTS